MGRLLVRGLGTVTPRVFYEKRPLQDWGERPDLIKSCHQEVHFILGLCGWKPPGLHHPVQFISGRHLGITTKCTCGLPPFDCGDSLAMSLAEETSLCILYSVVTTSVIACILTPCLTQPAHSESRLFQGSTCTSLKLFLHPY